MKAVFEALPVGSFWHVIYRPITGPAYEKHFNKDSEETWERLKHYLYTEDIPELTEILIDQIMAWYNAIGKMLYDINIPKLREAVKNVLADFAR